MPGACIIWSILTMYRGTVTTKLTASDWISAAISIPASTGTNSPTMYPIGAYTWNVRGRITSSTVPAPIIASGILVKSAVNTC